MTNYFIGPLIALILFSCAKKPGYDTVYKVAEQTNRFNDYDTDSVYVYLPSTLDAPRNVTIKSPFFQDEEILVKLKWTKEGLSIFSPDEDFRFDFSRNQKPVFTIPGSYRAYRCATNDLGECTNREEEDIETPWNKRAYFDPDLEGIDFSSSLTAMDIWQDDGCVIQKNTRLKDYIIKKGVINIELEREFRISSSDACLSKYLKYEASKFNTQDFSFKTTFFYSLVRLKDLASPGYKKFNYPLLDQKKFGYFLRMRKKLGENFRRVKKEYLLNRWDPDREFLTYHLSESFNEPGMEIFKQETYKSVEDMNKVLEEAEVPFKIRLEEPSGKKSGDLRYNTIVLITDPLRNGLLGYGPTVSNPITGEILQGHINMYSGVLTSIVPHIYDQMVLLSHNELNLKYRGGDDKRAVTSLPAAGARVVEAPKNIVENRFRRATRENINLLMNPDYWSPSSLINPPTNLKFENPFLKRIDFFAKHNAYPSDLYLSGGSYKDFLPGIKELKEIWYKNGTLMKWDDLNLQARKKINVLILPHVYRTTFIHEFGHNLGLRHNFKGSVDRRHFYRDKLPGTSTDERSKTIDGEIFFRPPQYSSIMDYGYSELNQLPIFGKYDIAALKYGYARKIDVITNEQKLKTVNLGKKGILPIHMTKLVPYEFCTDENAGTDPLCNRFDEGVTYVDIVKHYISKYKNNYYRSNFRNEKTNFNRYGNTGYFWWRYTEFSRIRKIFESFEDSMYNILKDKTHLKTLKQKRNEIDEVYEVCKDGESSFCKRFRDLYLASAMAGNFFIDVIQKPEHTCVMKTEFGYYSLLLKDFHRDNLLTKAPKSCFDQELLDQYASQNKGTPVAERGRYLTDLKEYHPDHNYTSDISVRGIWLDKVLAMQFLFGRNLPTSKVDDPEYNFLEHPLVGEKLEIMRDYMFDQSEILGAPAFTGKNGAEVVGIPALFLSLRYNKINNPEIPPQNSRLLNYFLRLPWRSSFRLNNILINTAENYLSTTSPKIGVQAKLDRNFFLVKKIEDHLIINKDTYRQTFSGGDGILYAASSHNNLATWLIQDIQSLQMIQYDSDMTTYIKQQSDQGMTIDRATLITQIIGQKSNPSVYVTERIDSLNRSIETKITSYYKGFPPGILAIGRRGALALNKVLEMAKKKSNLSNEDFIENFGVEDGLVFANDYSADIIPDIEKSLNQIGGEVDALLLSIEDLNKTIAMAEIIEKGEGTIESVLKKDEAYFGHKKIILSKMKAVDIIKIREFLLATTKIPDGFPAKYFYHLSLESLKRMKNIVESKDREELEYTLKNLPSY
ncbi:MAG: hypothetical protein DRQ88_07390 [Epsilonproteobacteria bacterium]|nr:MAG: hypothetical protein DRQ89_07825 [Campylobacterota bacterium]RLA66222.1 MAG: hypothetical protein DRQ88_07390 [Campylobacterota bacterium]